MSAVTTHVLDAAHGRPAAGVGVRLEGPSPEGRALEGRDVLAEAWTDDDGRVRDLGPDVLAPGDYRLVFDTGSWFRASGTPAFYPEVVVAFTVTADAAHWHVPLLLSPFAFSTYRGS